MNDSGHRIEAIKVPRRLLLLGRSGQIGPVFVGKLLPYPRDLEEKNEGWEEQQHRPPSDRGPRRPPEELATPSGPRLLALVAGTGSRPPRGIAVVFGDGDGDAVQHRERERERCCASDYDSEMLK